MPQPKDPSPAKSAQPRATHVLYLDDSGTKEYSPSGVYSVGNTRNFLFAGLLMPVEEAARLKERVEQLKLECFRVAEVEVKANWLKRPEERAKRYLKPYGLTDARLTAFTDALYGTINEADVKLLACVVDKVHMREDYGQQAHYPPAAAYSYVLQRAELEMRECNGHLLVVVDNMDGATPKGRQYRSNLEALHAKLRTFGLALMKPAFRYDHVGTLRFRDSKHDHRIQLADLVAYAVYRQFVDYGELWERENKHLPAYTYLARILGKFRCDGGGRVQGFGIVKAPLRNRVPWGVERKKKP